MTKRVLLLATAGVLFGATDVAVTHATEIAGAARAELQAGEIAMTHPTRAATLKVPGATLYYETQGSGPLLLIIPGGPQDAGVFSGLSHLLSDRYTVVAYDPRGNSRSAFDGAPVALDLDTQADDAAALIGALGGGPAYVFGTSGGAQIGLNLAARYPELVTALLAHEPPTILLLDDPSAALAAEQSIYDTYKRDGVDAAMGEFFGTNNLDAGDAPEEGAPPFDMPPEAMETFARVSGNFEYWLAHGMIPLGHYQPDVATLRAGAPRVVVALGEESEGEMIYDMGIAAANALGSEPLLVPGDHMGFEMHAEAFAEAMHKALQGK